MVTGTLLCLTLVIASIGGLFVAGGALASSGASTSPLLGLWVNGTSSASQLGVTQQVWSDYVGGSNSLGQTACDTGYSPPSIPGGGTLMLGVGACTQAQSESIANTLVAAGQSHAIIRVMWEFNNNLSGWFQNWNQLTLPTAASFISAFDTVAAGFRAVSPNFQIMWNPNGGTGNTNGVSWQSEYPGKSEVNIIGVDQYDFSGYAANIQAAVSFAQAQGLPVAIPEWGLNGSDDPSYVNDVAGIVNNPANDFDVQAYFSYAGSINSDITQFPQSEAAFRADFAATSANPQPPVTTTTTPPVTTTTAPPVTTTAPHVTTTTAPPVTTTTAPPVTTTTAPPVTTTTAPPVTTTTAPPVTRTTAPPVTTTTAPPVTTTTAPQVITTTVAPPTATVVATTRTPGAPTGVKASVKGNKVTLSWTNRQGTFGDDVFRDGQEIAWPGWPEPAVTTYQDIGVPAGSHIYYVAAYNSAGVGTGSTTVTVSVTGATGGSSGSRATAVRGAPRRPAITPGPTAGGITADSRGRACNGGTPGAGGRWAEPVRLDGKPGPTLAGNRR